jgi:nickel/cobalt exporter
MPSFPELLGQGAASAWLFAPSAILLGALHGLEPGHSKTMMAAFIVAVRGTVWQAALLGLAATASHTLVVWAIALGGMYLWRGLAPDAVEPWLQLASGVIVIAMAAWMIWRARREAETRRVAGQGGDRGARHAHPAHHHDHHHDHGHDHDHAPLEDGEPMDAHQRLHAREIETRFSGGSATTGQIVAFGLTGGLIPCPAAITVLLLCLQVRELTLGFALVLCFSIGLAITLVSVGAAAALGVRSAAGRFPWLSAAARRAPYVSGLLIMGVGLYMLVHGWSGLVRQA